MSRCNHPSFNFKSQKKLRWGPHTREMPRSKPRLATPAEGKWCNIRIATTQWKVSSANGNCAASPCTTRTVPWPRLLGESLDRHNDALKSRLVTLENLSRRKWGSGYRDPRQGPEHLRRRQCPCNIHGSRRRREILRQNVVAPKPIFQAVPFDVFSARPRHSRAGMNKTAPTATWGGFFVTIRQTCRHCRQSALSNCAKSALLEASTCERWPVSLPCCRRCTESRAP